MMTVTQGSLYGGTWAAKSVTGNYLGTEKNTIANGNSASLTFSGENVSILYRGYPTVFGNMEVRIDGEYVATINQSTSKLTLKNRWSSNNLGAGTHTVTLTKLSGTYVTLDAIIVSGPPTATPTASNTFTPTSTRTPTPTKTALPPVGYGTYDERNARIVYNGTWAAKSVTGNYLNTEKYTIANGNSARLTFTGENVSVLYRGYPTIFGNMEVRIDGEYVATINQSTPKLTLKNRWSSNNLGSGIHTITLTKLSGTYVTLDAIIVSGPPTATPTASNTFTPTSTRTPTPTKTALPPVSYGTYDERMASIVYSGVWAAQALTGNYLNTEKYTVANGNSARLTFTGENVSILYRGYPTVFGKMEVRIDGVYVATIDQSTLTRTYKNRWSSDNLGPGTHTITLTKLSGTYVTLDAIIVSGLPTATPTATLN